MVRVSVPAPWILAPERVEEVGQIDHLRLTGGVFDHGATVSQGGGHHQVLGTGHGNHVHQDVGTFQAAVDAGFDVALFDDDLRPSAPGRGHAG